MPDISVVRGVPITAPRIDRRWPSPLWLLVVIAGCLPLFVLQPGLDILASQPFYNAAVGPQHGFWLREFWGTVFLHESLLVVLRGGGVLLAGYGLWLWRTKRQLGWLDARGAAFLVLALAIGPGLVTNSVMKDQWGRARPFHIGQFGGNLDYSPALFMADQCPSNCSFFSGDGAAGFMLHAPLYLVPLRQRRRAFWLGWLGGGLVFGGNRVIMGAHFLSDVLFAGMTMLVVGAALHAVFYGWRNTRDRWHELLFNPA